MLTLVERWKSDVTGQTYPTKADGEAAERNHSLYLRAGQAQLPAMTPYATDTDIADWVVVNASKLREVLGPSDA